MFSSLYQLVQFLQKRRVARRKTLSGEEISKSKARTRTRTITTPEAGSHKRPCP